VEIETDTPPRVLKHRVLLHLEEQLGRKRSKDKYAPRTVDLGLALDDDLNLKREGLTLSDPASVQCPFLAIPLREWTPDWVLLRLPMGEVGAELPHGRRRAAHAAFETGNPLCL
jgi:7,8-dihydro-6-hydroxymethylpterin-pyrophosphokinase